MAAAFKLNEAWSAAVGIWIIRYRSAATLVRTGKLSTINYLISTPNTAFLLFWKMPYPAEISLVTVLHLTERSGFWTLRVPYTGKDFAFTKQNSQNYPYDHNSDSQMTLPVSLSGRVGFHHNLELIHSGVYFKLFLASVGWASSFIYNF